MMTRFTSPNFVGLCKLGAVNVVVLVIVLLSIPAQAAQTLGSFDVLIKLHSEAAISQMRLCRSSNVPGAFGAIVTVVCSTGTVTDISAIAAGPPFRAIHGGAYRFLTRTGAGEIFHNIDSYTGNGTTTAMRVVRLLDREYIEMTVGW